MFAVFMHSSALQNINISNWTCPNVTNVGMMFTGCNNLTNDSLISIAKMLVNASLVTYKNLNSTNTNSPFYYCNKTINEATVGADLVAQLQNHGWTL